MQKNTDEHISRSGTQLPMLNVIKHLHIIILKTSTISSIKATTDHATEISGECYAREKHYGY